jgi:hypothetical protein
MIAMTVVFDAVAAAAAVAVIFPVIFVDVEIFYHLGL